MKTFNLILGISCLSMLVSCQQKTAVQVKVSGWENEKIYVLSYVWSMEEEYWDSLYADENGCVVFEGRENDTTDVLLSAAKSCTVRPSNPLINDSYSVETLLLPGKYERVEGKLTDKGLVYTSDGTGIQQEKAGEHMALLPIQLKMDSIQAIIENTSSYQQTLYDAKDVFWKQKVAHYIRYIKKNPSAQLSGYYLSRLPYDSLKKYISVPDDGVRYGLYRWIIDRVIEREEEYERVKEAQKTIREGMPAPDFTLCDMNGIRKSLSQFRGKWVLLDFWGTWCGGCIQGIPAMRDAYDKYRDRMEIIGIACNEKKAETWKQFVASREMEWTNLLNEPEKGVPVLYGVEVYPTQILINPDGVIRKVVMGGNMDFHAELPKIIGE